MPMIGAAALSDRLHALEQAAKTGVLDDAIRIEVDAIANSYAGLIAQAGALRSRYL